MMVHFKSYYRGFNAPYKYFSGLATISLDPVTLNVCPENSGGVSVCAVISGLPSGGLGCDIIVEVLVTGDGAGILFKKLFK